MPSTRADVLDVHDHTRTHERGPSRRRVLAWLLLGIFSLLSVGECRAQSSQETIQSVRRKMVKIFGAGGFQRLSAYCSGFLVSPQGHIVTIWSPVLDAPTVSVILDDGRKFSGKIIGAEPQLDLALLKIEAEDLPYFDLSKSIAKAGPGTRVLGFSNMFKVATGNEPVSVIHGVISAHTKLQGKRGSFEITYPGPVYIVDAITNNSGAAGGVLTTRDGRLLAMIGKELRNAQSQTWVNYALPLTDLKVPIEDLIAGRYTPRTNDALSESLELPRYRPADAGFILIPDVVARTPAYIERVIPQSPAAQVGLQAEDLILYANGELISSCKQLSEVFAKLEAESNVELVVRRGAGLQKLKLKLPPLSKP